MRALAREGGHDRRERSLVRWQFRKRIEGCFRHGARYRAAAIADPFEQAFFAMVHLPYPQPFEDVNKRVSRLAANISLIRENLCPLSFVDVPERAYVDGTLGVYELNRIELLRDVFVWAYERSCARYSAVRESMGEPDPFRLRYRALVTDAVSEIVGSGMDKKVAAAFIKRRASEDVPREDQARFIEVVETAVMSLHEGEHRPLPPAAVAIPEMEGNVALIRTFPGKINV